MKQRYLRPAVLIAVAVNLLLVVLYLWSRGGQESLLRLESVGGAYRATLDGKPVVPGIAFDGPKLLPLDAPLAGTVQITLPRRVPSLPRPSGVDSIVVRTPSGSGVLFQDNFDSLNLNDWQVLSGSFDVKDGVLFATGYNQTNTLILKRDGWSDYTIDLHLRNTMSGTLASHVTPDGGVFYNFELVRDFPNFVDVHKGGTTTSVPFGGFPHASEMGTFKSLAAMLTRPYPYILVGLLAGAALTFVLAVGAAAAHRVTPRIKPIVWLDKAGTVVALIVAAGAFGLTLFIHHHYYGGIPHVPDEVAYVFQAKLFAAGHIMGHIPPVKEAFYFYQPSSLYERGSSWASFYPFGHSLVLAIGAFFGSVHWVPSAVGAGCVLALYTVGRQFYGARTALLAVILLASSPFFLMQSSSFMSHNTAALYVLLSLVFILKRGRPIPYGLLGGIFFGLVFNTRPLSAVALIPPYAVLLLSYLRAKPTRRDGVKQIAAFVVGGMLMMLAFLAYNYGLTGSPTHSSYAGNDGSAFGFVKGHTFDIGIRNEQAQTMALGLVFNNWPIFAGFALLLTPFLLGTRNRWDYFCLVSALLPMGAYTFYRYSGLYEGPRYWYEVAPFLYLLAARGAECAAAFIQRTVDDLRWRMKMPTRAPFWAAAVPIYLLIAVFIVQGSGSWFLGTNKAWTDSEAHLVPQTADAMNAVFDVNPRLNALAAKTKLDNALVLVRPCGFFGSVVCYGTVFLRNNLSFNGNVVWAQFMPERNAEIIAAYPGRKVYVASADGTPSIVPYVPGAP